MDTRIPAMVLAAGQASRMGRAKQLLRVGDSTLLQLAVERARMVTGLPPIVVTGARHELMETDLATQNVQFVHNPEWKTGMGSSIAAGVRELRYWHPAASGCLITLVDQPLISIPILEGFIHAFHNQESQIVVAAYQGTQGVPAIFSRTYFAELEALHTGGGAKHLIQKHQSQVCAMECPEASLDIDTPDDWAQFLSDEHDK